jgi:hypothetical protein
MKAARWRLGLAAAGFLAWIGWLAYLAATTTHPVVLSRPQFLQADYYVIAEVGEASGHPDPRVAVLQLYSAPKKPGKTLKHILVQNLSQMAKENGWDGPGRYILPLEVKSSGPGPDTFVVARIPRSPGYPSRSTDSPARERIYPDNPETRGQLDKIREGEWEE